MPMVSFFTGKRGGTMPVFFPGPGSNPSLNRLLAWFAAAGLAAAVVSPVEAAFAVVVVPLAAAVWAAGGWDWTFIIGGTLSGELGLGGALRKRSVRSSRFSGSLARA